MEGTNEVNEITSEENKREPLTSFSKDPDAYIDETLDLILGKLGDQSLLDTPTPSKKSSVTPYVEDKQLSCAGQELTFIPSSWGELYGDQIHYLDLSYNSLTEIQGLEPFQKLETLVLDNNELGDKIKLPKILSLKTLTLNNNNIQDIGLFLVKVSVCFPNLEYLSILKNPACCNPLMGGSDDDYQKYRYRVINSLRKLKFLDSTQVTASERRATAEVFDNWEFREERGDSTNTETTIPVPQTETPSVVSSETRIENKFVSKPFTVYQVTMVNATGKKCSVYRRYNDFLSLHQQLSKQFSSDRLPSFPPKRLIGNNFDPKFIQERRLRLHQYIQGVLSKPDIRSSPAMREFLTNDILLSPSAIRELNGEKGKVTIDDFNLLRVIGKGSFGKVMLVQFKKDGRLYAMKVLSKKKVKQHDEVEHIKSERQVLMANTKHPFLVGLRFSFHTSSKLYFVLDYVSGGELFFHLQAVKRFPESQAQFYAAEILLAIEYLHQMNIIYRDLKPENVLLDSEGHVALTDFGLSKVVAKTTSTFCGTPEYLAPEVLKKQEYGFAVDWWCFGSVIYEMMVGLPPFYCRDFNEMYRRILNQPVRFPPHISEKARDLIKKLLDKDPRKRLGGGPGNGSDVKAHPFFEGIDWEKLYNRQVPPPFVPNSGDLGINNFDKQFVNEPIPKSIIEEDKFRVDVEIDDAFSGFSYTEEDSFGELENKNETKV